MDTARQTSVDMTQREIRHKEILDEFYKLYADRESDINEFTWDGPSDWTIWEAQKPKILFLGKEARQGAQPCIPGQKVESKFAKNVARWKLLIKEAHHNDPLLIHFPDDNQLSETNDDIAIVEVKKLNEEKHKSSDKEILEYAKRDKVLLRKQINEIDPTIVVCCSTFDAYDEIYDFSYDVENKLVQYKRCSCWLLNNRLVFDFYHPSTWQQWVDPNDNDREYFEVLAALLADKKVQEHLRK